jgi:hypothetical protein
MKPHFQQTLQTVTFCAAHAMSHPDSVVVADQCRMRSIEQVGPISE